jgi:hypothetical protein
MVTREVTFQVSRRVSVLCRVVLFDNWMSKLCVIVTENTNIQLTIFSCQQERQLLLLLLALTTINFGAKQQLYLDFIDASLYIKIVWYKYNTITQAPRVFFHLFVFLFFCLKLYIMTYPNFLLFLLFSNVSHYKSE